MALDRQSIERRDFPIARRGYDIEAVDAHLQGVADEVEALRRTQVRARSETLASSASEQVRAIIEAAESSAAEIERDAGLEARQIRQDAREEAERVRSEAGRQAREHVQRVADAARAMLERVQSMDQDLGGLLETVRGGASRVSGDLGLLEASVAALQSAADEAPLPPPAPPAPAVEAPDASEDPDADPALAASPDAAAAAAAALPAASDPVGGATPTAPPRPVGTSVQERTRPRRPRPADRAVGPVGLDGTPASPDAGESPGRPAGTAPDAERDGDPAAPASGDEEGARLIALNMALNGTPRDEAERYLRANFELADAAALLDDVYTRSGR